MSKYKPDKFRHVTVALNTPFKKDGSVDTEAIKKVCRYFRGKGVRQMYVCGSTGEGFLLDTEERMLVSETVVNEVGDDMNIIVHVGCADTRHSAMLAAHAEKIGAAATSAVPCVYYHVSEESVYRHWTEITMAADLPFFIYNIPQLTGFHLSLNLFKKMLDNERVAGVKCSSEPVQDILSFKQTGGKDFLVFNGPDEQYVAGRLMGADAGIGGTYGAMPELFLKLADLVKANDMETARKLQYTVNEIIYKLCSGHGNMYGIIKAVLKRNEGLELGGVRAPLASLIESDEAVVKEAAQMILDAKAEYGC